MIEGREEVKNPLQMCVIYELDRNNQDKKFTNFEVGNDAVACQLLVKNFQSEKTYNIQIMGENRL